MSTKVPKHIAVIMDGNGRWAQGRGWPRTRGHVEGAKAVREIVQGCLDVGVEYLTLFAFSVDNWQRPKAEVELLLGLLPKFLRDHTADMGKRGVRFQAIGRLQELPADCQRAIDKAARDTAHNQRLTAILAVNYSGKAEIIDAVKKIVTEVQGGRLEASAIDVPLFNEYLYTKQYPDPDLLIRTSGEMRVSNFLLWQVSYSEIYVIKKFWPDFTKQDLYDAVDEFNRRQRRYGAVEVS